MIKPNPKDVPMGEVWAIEAPVGREGSWMAVRNIHTHDHSWTAVRLDFGGLNYLADSEVRLVHRISTKADIDDPIVYSIRQSQVDAVTVVKNEDGDWCCDNLLVARKGDLPESVTATITKPFQKRIVSLLAVRQAIDAEQDQVRDQLRAIAPEGDESTLATLAADPSIIAALGGDRYA